MTCILHLLCFLSLMKKNNLCLLIFGLLIFLLPVLAMASSMPRNQVAKVEQIVTISQNCAIPQDFDQSNSTEGNAEVQIRILRDEISAPLKMVSSALYIEIHLFSKNIYRQIITSDQQELIPISRNSILFTGALRV